MYMEAIARQKITHSSLQGFLPSQPVPIFTFGRGEEL